MKRWIMAAAMLAAGTGSALAHAVWLAPRQGEWIVVYGVGPQDERYDPAKLKSVQALVDGATRDVVVTRGETGAKIAVPAGASVVTATMDNGFWSKGPDGVWENRSKRDVPGVQSSTHTMKFNTHVVTAGAPLGPRGLPMEIVPLADPLSLKPGDPLPVEVRRDGRPVRGVALHHDYVGDANTLVAKTDADGRATVTVRNHGLNVIGAEMAVPTPDDPDADRLGLFATLSFVTPFKEE